MPSLSTARSIILLYACLLTLLCTMYASCGCNALILRIVNVDVSYNFDPDAMEKEKTSEHFPNRRAFWDSYVKHKVSDAWHYQVVCSPFLHSSNHKRSGIPWTQYLYRTWNSSSSSGSVSETNGVLFGASLFRNTWQKVSGAFWRLPFLPYR